MAVEWFTRIDGSESGPIDGRKLKEMAKSGQLKPNDQIRRSADGQWNDAKKAVGLFSADAMAVASASTPQPNQKILELEFSNSDDFLEQSNRSPARKFKFPSLAVCLSVTALLTAVVALVCSLLRDPMGRGLASYDFATPESAAKSMSRIEASDDIRARLELISLKIGSGGTSEEINRTFEISRIADFQDRKIIFVSYMRKGKKQRELYEFEKDLESKRWLPSPLSFLAVQKPDEKLFKEMEAWIMSKKE